MGITNDAANKYRRVSVTILIEKGSDLEKRIQEYAEEDDISFREAASFAARLGITHHMMGNLDLLLRSHKNT